ncbi:endonuclease/exonuclease/phosphatase family protein [Polaribacter sp.]|uniref:endonuclease/exonuclease/phosphatase family protein n=1 Tax=Polaribacter sp. TaxID=1920175 RepID=UPI004047EA16
MKIVSWNCNGAFRNKFEFILDLNADIYIIQECENPRETSHKNYQKWAENYIWIGDSKNKGLGIFAKKEFKLKKLNWSNKFKDHSVKYFLPCSVNNEFELLAVWTHRNNSPNFGYIGQFWKYFQVNKKNFKTILLAGDFNSNSIWDEWDRWWNHSDVVKDLQELRIESLYHKFTNEKQGFESKPTLFFQKKIDRPYHIDYFFGSDFFQKKLKFIEIGNPEKWLSKSDHMPIFCEFN